MTEHVDVRASGLDVVEAANAAQSTYDLTADAVVIGSGAGGAIAAYELAKTGKKVIVLEAGRYVPSQKMTEMSAVSLGTMYADSAGQANAQGDITILQGACVGGSTVVNAALCFRTPDFYFKLWGERFGLTNLTTVSMTPYFEKVEKNIWITPNEDWETSPGAELIKEGLVATETPIGIAKRNVKDCALTGFCFAGCKTERKQSMLVTYLPWAQAHGTEIYADTRVNTITSKDGVANGVTAEMINPDTKEKVADITVSAPIVVLAAGPIQSPIILMKSGLANSSGQVGQNFACHPSLSLTAEFDTPVDDFTGATHSVYVDEYTLPDENGVGGFILLNAIEQPVFAGASQNPGTGKPYISMMEKFANTIRLITLLHDKNSGNVTYKDGVKTINYTVDDEDFEAMKDGLKVNARILMAAGAVRVYIPTTLAKVIESEDQIDTVIDSLKNEKSRYPYTSFHPQGTLRMGADPATTVVSPMGETHDVKNLYVVDASLLPTSIGYNPSETVFALASYISDQINAAHE
ncbi:MAG: GMC family oxidoreductase [Proteobacteria bacterium]|jgi:choline dehydrogenase-like flavoprotein|nr:GMC family oxidoreductase [Pseudomonadota bacterium]|tara:strand:+ start:1779 stop:3344 length:1566 start_codon:yes stop_codon:yes gene_type:complete